MRSFLRRAFPLNGSTSPISTRSSSKTTPTHRVGRWRAPSHPRRSAAARPDPGPRGWRGILGRRVSVRFRLLDDPGHAYSEALGVVQAVRDAGEGDLEIEVITRTGRTALFAASHVTHLKVFE